MSASPEAGSAPLWHRVWLALLAPLYFISPLALLSLPSLRTLPRSAQGLLLLYALSQQLPALLTSSPVEASLLALARTLLMGGLIGMGVQWRRSERLMPLGIGLILVFATALVISLINGVPLLSSRLSHPYMTSITLGLAGALAFWLGLFGQGKPWWRVLLDAWRQSGSRDNRAAHSATGAGSSGCQSLRQTTVSCSRPPRSRGHNEGSATSRQPLVSR